MAPRWTAADDAAVSAAASARSGREWPGWVDCPNRGRITADEASKRHCVLGKRPRPRGTIANGEVPSVDPAVKPAAQRTQRSTPMRDRAEKAGVVVKPTPGGLREAVASPRVRRWRSPRRCLLASQTPTKGSSTNRRTRGKA